VRCVVLRERGALRCFEHSVLQLVSEKSFGNTVSQKSPGVVRLNARVSLHIVGIFSQELILLMNSRQVKSVCMRVRESVRVVDENECMHAGHWYTVSVTV